MEIASDALVLTYAELNSSDSLDGLVAQYFKEQVETLSDGTISIDLQLSGVLGSEDDILSTMTLGGGTVDLCRISMSALTNYGGTMSQLVSVPYIFESNEHYWNFTESEIGQEILDEAEDLGLGVKGLFYMGEGFRNFFFVDEISGFDDIAGLKIRVNSDPAMANLVEALGASATVISSGEVYTSLQSGVVDGADQPTLIYESSSYDEVAKYLLEDEHFMSVSEVVVAQDVWDGLTEDQQNILAEAGEAASAYCEELLDTLEEECKTRLEEESGVTIVAVDDKTVYQDACEDMIADMIEGLEDTYEAILATK